MSNMILEKYRSLKPLNDEAAVNAMLGVLVEIPPSLQNDFWVREADVGSFCLYENDMHPNKVLEYVQGSADDSVTTLYEPNSILQSRAALIDARRELIAEIGRVLLALPSTVAVYDSGRERQVMLRELGTAQLYDVLAHFAGKQQHAI